MEGLGLYNRVGMSEREPLIFLSAGEASGEHYGALLLEELKARFAGRGVAPRFFGMGGERMEALGCERIVKSEDVAVIDRRASCRERVCYAV